MSFPPPYCGGPYSFPPLHPGPQRPQEQYQGQAQNQNQNQNQSQHQPQFQQYHHQQQPFAYYSTPGHAPTQTFQSDQAAYYHPSAAAPSQSQSQSYFTPQQQQQQQQQQRQQRYLPPPFLHPMHQQPAVSPSPLYARASAELPPVILPQPQLHRSPSETARGSRSGTATEFGMGMNMGMGMGMGVGGEMAGGMGSTTPRMSAASSSDYYLSQSQNRYGAGGVSNTGYGGFGVGVGVGGVGGFGGSPMPLQRSPLQAPQASQASPAPLQAPLQTPQAAQPPQSPFIAATPTTAYTPQPPQQHHHATAAYAYNITSASPTLARANSTSFPLTPSFQQQAYDRVIQQQQQQQQQQQVSQPPVQLYATSPLPHRGRSQQQPPAQSQSRHQGYHPQQNQQYQRQEQQQQQQQHHHQQIPRQQHSGQSLPHTPTPAQQPFKKPTPQSQSSNSSVQRSGFPKIEVQIFRTPQQSQSQNLNPQSLQHPRSMSPAKEVKRRSKKHSIASLPARDEPVPPDPSIDYQTLLLSLADEYFDAAHIQGSTLAASRKQSDIDAYYHLVATGLACLEVVLKSRKLPPQVEAIVRLRYALVLYEETDNDFEVESTLTKGIDLCERNQLLDLKYTMQQILARTLFKSNSKAALKTVDGMISEAEAYHNNAWEYAFKFLRASLSLSSPFHQDHAIALQNLRSVSSTAEQRGDKAVAATANVLEALAHLHNPSGSDAVEQAQRCLEQARNHELGSELTDLPHISTMLQLIDIMISLLSSDSAQATAKLPLLQQTMDTNLDNNKWRQDGVFFVPVPSAGKVAAIKSGLALKSLDDNTVGLTMAWLSKHDLYALTYFISAVILSGKTVQDAIRAEKFLKEGLALVADGITDPLFIGESLAYSSSRLEWRQCLRCSMLLQLILIACAKSDFDVAIEHMKSLNGIAEQLGDGLDIVTKSMILYVKGVIHQSIGDLDSAITAYQNPIFDLEPFKSKRTQICIQRDIAILAALNTVILHYEPQSPSLSIEILQRVEPYCQNNPNQRVKAAYHIISATIRGESSVQTKQDLSFAVNIARETSNIQVTYLAVSFLAWKYFSGVISEQAEKNTMLAHATAKLADNKLWRSITEELLADSLERHGKPREAVAAKRRADAIVATLPPALREVNSS